MADKEMTRLLEEINHKLDYLTVQVRQQERKQREFEELKHDLMIIGKDAFQTTVMELEELSPHFETRDLVQLIKKLLRNTRNINTLLDQVESIADFIEDIKPLGKQGFTDLLHKMDQLDKKGYFAFLREATQIIDTVVTSFSVDDVRLLRENVTSILLTVKNLTQPEMLATMDNAVGFYRKMDIVVDQDVSYRKIIRALKDPEVKRGLVFMLEFVKNMAAPENRNGAHKPTSN